VEFLYPPGVVPPRRCANRGTKSNLMKRELASGEYYVTPRGLK